MPAQSAHQPVSSAAINSARHRRREEEAGMAWGIVLVVWILGAGVTALVLAMLVTGQPEDEPAGRAGQ